MDSKDIGGMERAGDVSGLVRALKGVRTHEVGGVTSGAEAHDAMTALGFDILPGAGVKIVELSKVRLVDDSTVLRAEAAAALGRLNHRDGNLALVDSLGDRAELVRLAVVDVLGAIGGEPMRGLLAGFEERDSYARLSVAAKARALLERR